MIVVDKKKEKLVRFFLFEIINLKVDKVRYSGYNYRILEIMCFYLVISLASLFVGYIIYDLCTVYGVIEICVSEDAVSKVENVSVLMLLKNNIIFFCVVSVFPVINLLFVVMQFFQLGTLIYSCKDMNIFLQFVLLYRHTFFEIIALFIAIYISYIILIVGKQYINDVSIDKVDYKKILRKIGFCYLIVVVATVIGALLEGNVHV